MKVVITVISDGLRRAIALEFSNQGHTVCGCGRSATQLRELKQGIGPQHDFAIVDVAQAAEVKAWARHVIQRHGAPDLLLNNAAVINSNARLREVSAPEVSRLLDADVRGVANVIRHVVPR